MALFTDDGPSKFEDWVSYDSKLLLLSEQENTSVEAKSELAKQVLESELRLFVINNAGLRIPNDPSLLTRIVVTEPLKRWHSLQTLFLYYDDIASMQASRAQRQRSLQYLTRGSEARATLFEIGVAFVNAPIPQATVPKVLREVANGPSFNLKARTQFVGSGGSVGSPSREFWIQSSDGESVSLQFSGLPNNVIGWNLYLQDAENTFRCVNQVPIGEGALHSINSAEFSFGEKLMSEGQAPDYFVRINRVMRP